MSLSIIPAIGGYVVRDAITGATSEVLPLDAANERAYDVSACLCSLDGMPGRVLA